MAKKIWKAALSDSPISIVSMPVGAEIVHVHEQEGRITLWFLCDWAVAFEHRKFEVVGTGEDVPKGGRYVGTAHLDPYVWHVFEVK